MKKHKLLFSFLLFTVFISQFSSAYIFVGDNITRDLTRMTWMKPLTQDFLDKVHRGKTIFCYRSKDEPISEVMNEVFQSAWDFNELELQEFAAEYDMEFEKGNTYAMLNIHGLNGVYYIELNFSYLDDKNQWTSFASMDLTHDYKDIGEIAKKLSYSKISHWTAVKHVYDHVELKTWKIGLLKNGLQEINRRLQSNISRFRYANGANHNILKLKSNTLLVIEEDFTDARDVFEHFTFDFKLVTAEQINEKIIDGKEEFFYAQHIRCCNQFYFCIVNGITGEIVYSDFINRPFGFAVSAFNVKSKDIKRLNRIIERFLLRNVSTENDLTYYKGKNFKMLAKSDAKKYHGKKIINFAAPFATFGLLPVSFSMHYQDKKWVVNSENDMLYDNAEYLLAYRKYANRSNRLMGNLGRFIYFGTLYYMGTNI